LSNLAALPHLEHVFNKLAAAGYEKSSDATDYPPTPGSYNCIAWAAHDRHHFLWPDPDLEWPFWSKRLENREAFVAAFRGLGYFVCDHSRFEFWFERVALYEYNGSPKHMARQLRDGTWTSKYGGWEDITHFTLDALESYGPHPSKAEYGHPVLYMKRFIVVAWCVRVLQWIEWKIESPWPYIGFFVWRRRQ
jgi:hypothetical protein